MQNVCDTCRINFEMPPFCLVSSYSRQCSNRNTCRLQYRTRCIMSSSHNQVFQLMQKHSQENFHNQNLQKVSKQFQMATIRCWVGSVHFKCHVLLHVMFIFIYIPIFCAFCTVIGLIRRALKVTIQAPNTKKTILL